VGSAACVGCHQVEFDAWRSSHHDLAMQQATSDTVLGDFSDAELTSHGVTSRFFMRDGKFFVNTDGPGGEMADFEVAYTFGVYPLQQYLIPFTDGRIQALGLAWDSRAESEGGQRWFHLYPSEPIDHRDELHWTSRQQNWNYQCADCHSTNYVKGYDIAENRFESAWSEINVACEACHGPGKDHVTWAAKEEGLRAEDVGLGLKILLRDRQDVAWTMDAETGVAKRGSPLRHPVEIGVCADCHSRRGTLRSGAQADPDFLDHHMPAFLLEGLYYPDGQIEDEVYVWGSFSQSKMHAAGVTCSDCHDPHSLQLRAEGDAVCAQCHLPSKFAVRAHSGHEGSQGSPACVDCHMPERTYMVVDPRKDHSIRIPRPDLSVKYGVPNACNQCHAGKTAEWAVNAFAKLYSGTAAPYQDWTAAFHLARSGLPQAEVALMGVIADEATPDIARATAVVELSEFLSPVSGQLLESALKDPSPLVRLAALRTLEVVPAPYRFALAKNLLDDPVLAIRSQAGQILADSPVEAMTDVERNSLQAAIRDYVATQEYNADRPESWLNLGNLHVRTGDLEQAEKDYRQALALAPDFGGGYLNLADLYRHLGRESESLAMLEQGLAARPDDAALHHGLGLARVRSQDQEAALVHLKRAVEIEPDNARFAYVYAVGLNSAGNADKAVSALSAAVERHPNDIQLMLTAAIFERDRGNLAMARQWAERALSVNPTDQSAKQFLQSLPSAPDQ